MVYEFKCDNKECLSSHAVIKVDIPIQYYEETVRDLKCDWCNEHLQRVYSSFGLRTFGDGYKV